MKSYNNPIGLTIKQITAINTIGLISIASLKLPSKNLLRALVVPHDGHGIFVTFLNTHTCRALLEFTPL